MYRKTPLYFYPEGDTGTPPAATAPEGGTAAEKQSRSLMDDLLKERGKRKEAEKELAAAKAETATAAASGLSEIEKLKARVEAAEQTAADAATKLARTTKADFVRRAAKDFHDPDDAVAIAETRGLLADVESDSDAERVVKALANERPHLVKTGVAPGSTEIQQILENGLGTAAPADTKPADDGSSVWTNAEMKAWTPKQMAAALENEKGKLFRSMEAAKVAA